MEMIHDDSLCADWVMFPIRHETHFSTPPVFNVFNGTLGHSINLVLDHKSPFFFGAYHRFVGKLWETHPTGPTSQIRVAWFCRQDLCRGGELFDRIAEGDLGGEAQAPGEVRSVES